MKSGWIKLHRSLLEWEWYDDVNVMRVFLHCLLKANHADKRYRGKIVKRGTFLTGRDLLSIETGLTVRQVRTSLEKLKSTNELTIKTSSKGTVVAIVNYDKYQTETNELANKRPASDQQTTTNKNDKNEKNEKKKKNKQKEIVLSFDSQKFKNAWGEWLVYLKQKRKTPTLLTQEKQMKFLESQGEDKAIASINRSITNGWQGLFAEKDEAETQTMADKIRAQNMKKLC